MLGRGCQSCLLAHLLLQGSFLGRWDVRTLHHSPLLVLLQPPCRLTVEAGGRCRSQEMKMEKINVCWAEGEMDRDIRAGCLFCDMPRDSRTLVPMSTPPLPSPCPGMMTGGFDFLWRPHHQRSVATMALGSVNFHSPNTPTQVPLSTLGGHQS